MFQVDEMYREAPIKHSMFDYIEFTRILKHGAKDKDDQWSLYHKSKGCALFLLQMNTLCKKEITLKWPNGGGH